MKHSPKRLLILTDHSKHSANNSFYALSSAFSALPTWEKVHVCSRGNKVNQNFFSGQEKRLWVTPHEAGYEFGDMQGHWREHLISSNLDEYDAILLRLPRPIRYDLFQLLEAHYAPFQIVNNPSGIRLTGNKKFLLNFPDISPPMKWVMSPEEAKEFSQRHEIVLKPGEEYGGKGILRLHQNTLWNGDEKIDIRYLNDLFLPEGMLAMKFLKNIHRGDKRTIVVNGKIIGSTIRFPSQNSWLCNVAQGGSAEISEPDEDDQKIVDTIEPTLREHGIILYGFDTLVDDHGRRLLSEINSLSIGGIAPLEKASGKQLSRQIAENITDYWTTFYEKTNSGS